MSLKGKHIVVGISGGIAAYKIPELIRLLVKQGAEVKTVVTRNALQFVTPVVLETLSNNAVYSDVFAPHKEHQTEHISLPDWADLMVVAPCTANQLGKFANGIADDALSTTFLATLCPVLLAPAMNENMLLHPATQANLRKLESFEHVHIMDSPEGFLACGTTGKGRMPEPEDIVAEIERVLMPKCLAGKRVMITAGPTQEQIDPVRYISNYSTGKMGYALAEVCKACGADVTLISGPSALKFSGKTVNVVSAADMFEAAKQEFEHSDIAILCAAVADYTPTEKAAHKIKREADSLTLELKATQDIAAYLGSVKQQGQVLVGFALETQNEEQNAIKKLQKKNLDYIVLNSLQDRGAGFGTDTNKVTVYSISGEKTELPLSEKKEVAEQIISVITKTK